jgi:hypothetical protein
MPSYNRRVTVPGKTSQELYDIISQNIDNLLTKFNVGKFDVSRDPGSKKVGISSSMFSATLLCQDGSVTLDGKLSLMATPFKSKIDEGIDRWVAKISGGPRPS